MVWATAEALNISPPTARIKSELEILLIISVITPGKESSSLTSHSSSYERDVRLVTTKASAYDILRVPSCPLWLMLLKALTTKDTKVHKEQIH